MGTGGGEARVEEWSGGEREQQRRWKMMMMQMRKRRRKERMARTRNTRDNEGI